MNNQQYKRPAPISLVLKLLACLVLLWLAFVLLFANATTLHAQSQPNAPSPFGTGPAPAAATPVSASVSASVPAAGGAGDLKFQPMIVGGENAAVGELPWQVAVFPGSRLCGGTLIDVAWVLTAAHCVVDSGGEPLSPADVQIVAGEYNLRGAEGGEQKRAVAQVIVHPSYQAESDDNDIALLRLAAPVTPGASVGVVPLVFKPANDALVAVGVPAMVSGWGTTSAGGKIASVLQKVRIPLVSNATCEQAYGAIITGNMLCAGAAAGGKDSCQGDSGGPLVVPDGAGWRLAGVVSFGYSCAQPGYYGVYTRVSQYTAWISSYVAGVAPTPGGIPIVAKEYLYLPVIGR